eukprot:gene26571-32112_t
MGYIEEPGSASLDKQPSGWEGTDDNISSLTSSSSPQRAKRRTKQGSYWKEDKNPTRRSPRTLKEDESNDGNSTTGRKDKEEEGNNEETIDYEALRLENIRRNEEYLKSIGLFNSTEKVVNKHSLNKKTPSSSAPKSAASPQRRSKRLLGELPEIRRSKRLNSDEGGEAEQTGRRGYWGWEDVVQKAFAVVGDGVHNAVDGYGDNKEENAQSAEAYVTYREVDISAERAPISAQQVLDCVAAACPAHLELISFEIIEHTAYRMGYMSNKQLVTRLNAITRAARKASYEKLLVFYYALLASGLADLADVAKATLVKIGIEF